MGGTLLIRADAGPSIGTGHVMRCLALAQAWQATGGKVKLLSHGPSDALRRQIRAAGVGFQPLPQPHPDPTDLAATLAALDQAKAERHDAPATWLVLDGYHFDVDYQQAIRRRGYRLLVVDDMAHLPHYHADLLLNQNMAAEKLDYACDDGTAWLLGPRFVLLRAEFSRREPQRRPAPEVARKILVTSGGADPGNVTLRVVRALRRLDLAGLDVAGLEVKIVVGPANPHAATLRTEVERSAPQMQLLTHVTDMPELMAWADVALSAAGSTCWELAYMGVPAAVVVVADNQQPIADELDRAGAVVHLGRSDRVTEEQIAAGLGSLCRDRRRRDDQIEAGRRLVDGRGPQRVVAVMEALDGPLPPNRLRLRPIDAQDMLPLWRLANHPTVRRNSLCPDPIPLDDHVGWFEGKLSSPDTCLWALDFHELMVGQIRYDRTEAGTAEISFCVAPAFRRRGLGARLLELTRRPACDGLGVERLRAVVRQENDPSARIFVKAGFAQVDARQVRGQACRIFEWTA